MSTANLVRRLEAAGLNPNSLDPWETWRVFKEFLDAPVTFGGYDSASFQWTGVVESDDEPAAFLVRQFTRRRGTEDVLVARLVVELNFAPRQLPPAPPCHLWTHDFATNSEWASFVEASQQFQQVMNGRPIRSEVYWDDIE